MGFRLLLYVILGVFAACLGVEEVDVHLGSVFLVFFVGKEVFEVSLVVLEIFSSSSYSYTVLMLKSIILTVMVEGTLSNTVIFSCVDWRW